jgi:hypothetical protein
MSRSERLKVVALFLLVTGVSACAGLSDFVLGGHNVQMTCNQPIPANPGQPTPYPNICPQLWVTPEP